MTKKTNPKTRPLYLGDIDALRQHHRAIDLNDLTWRKNQLKALKSMLKECEPLFLEALKKDLGKGKTESYITEIGFVRSEITHALKNISSWAQPQKIKTPLVLQPGKSEVIPEPYGVALIIGAWNYPINLTLSPLVSCISAGNAAVIKPSENAPETSKLIGQLLPKYLDPHAFKIIQGGIDETTELLKVRFDKIFFTGSRHVGSLVMKAAAEHVTPLTLELGGKSPCIVDKSADLDLAAKRIVFGKFTNAGQTCVAPDYVIAHKDIIAPLAKAFNRAIKEFYGKEPQTSQDYARIINKAHHKRLVKLMNGQKVLFGGKHDEDKLFIEPTILGDIDQKSQIMKEEIFGPLLPLLSTTNICDAFDLVRKKDKPLALYLFTKDKDLITLAKKTPAGGVCINDTIVHVGVPELPFGGVGGSGFGKYHGKNGFDDFSNLKGIYNASTKIDFSTRYPPYGRFKDFILRHFIK